MKLVLDTSGYSQFVYRAKPALAVVKKAKSIHLPIVTWSELQAGFSLGTQRAANERLLQQFIDAWAVEIIEIRREVGRLYTDCFTSLRQRGRPIPTNDIWIAACCQFVGGTLLTADQHFLSVNRLAVEFVGEAD